MEFVPRRRLRATSSPYDWPRELVRVHFCLNGLSYVQKNMHRSTLQKINTANPLHALTQAGLSPSEIKN
jgi:hypothetical protein